MSSIEPLVNEKVYILNCCQLQQDNEIDVDSSLNEEVRKDSMNEQLETGGAEEFVEQEYVLLYYEY